MGENKGIPIARLCGGYFLDRILEYRKSRTSVRKSTAGKTDGMSEPNVLAGLIAVAQPTFKQPAGSSFITSV